MKIPPYYKQEYKFSCSLAVLRMVLGCYGIYVSEKELIIEIEKDYGRDFTNLWNTTIAKLACQYKIKTTMYALWPLFKKSVFIKAHDEYICKGRKMNFLKYETKDDVNDKDHTLFHAYKDAFIAFDLGCIVKYGGITKKIIKDCLTENYLIQTSIRLNLMYPGMKSVYHSILIYGSEGDNVYFHDPTHGATKRCSFDHLLKASNNVGAFMIYQGRQ